MNDNGLAGLSTEALHNLYGKAQFALKVAASESQAIEQELLKRHNAQQMAAEAQAAPVQPAEAHPADPQEG